MSYCISIFIEGLQITLEPGGIENPTNATGCTFEYHLSAVGALALNMLSTSIA